MKGKVRPVLYPWFNPEAFHMRSMLEIKPIFGPAPRNLNFRGDWVFYDNTGKEDDSDFCGIIL